MATAGNVIRDLLERSRDLDQRAQAIQGAVDLQADDTTIDALVEDYQRWLAEGLAVLPSEFADRFRQEYEGNWHSNKIKDFLSAPGSISPFWDPDVENPLVPRWSSPYESAFKAPLVSQRQILAEAAHQLEGPGGASQDLELLERLCRRFSEFLLPFSQRGRGREPFVIEDEYDVQVAFEAILRLFFDDVRPEDFTPERGGARSRVDFLLKAERIIVETKMTRAGLGAKGVGEQLYVDIKRYQAHPECGALVALVYDPDKHISNRRALEYDLSGTHDGLVVRVFIVQ